jgi:hypothetical protein
MNNEMFSKLRKQTLSLNAYHWLLFNKYNLLQLYGVFSNECYRKETEQKGDYKDHKSLLNKKRETSVGMVKKLRDKTMRRKRQGTKA